MGTQMVLLMSQYAVLVKFSILGQCVAINFLAYGEQEENSPE